MTPGSHTPPGSGDPYVAVPMGLFDLVADRKISKNAAWLYALLLGHVNRKRGDAYVWPSRRKLADRMGMSETRAVDRYLDELIDAGLVHRDHRRKGNVNESNRYELLLLPGVGGSAQMNTTPEGGSAQPSTRGSAQTNTRVVLNQTPGVVLNSAPELKEVELEEFEPEENQPSLSAREDEQAAEPSTPDEGQERERDGLDFLDPKHRAEARLYVGKLGYDGAERDYLIKDIHRRCEVKTKAFWSIAYHRDGSLEQRCDESIKDYRAVHAPETEPATNSAARCPLHPSFSAAHCAACIGDAKAAGTMPPSAQARTRIEESTSSRRADQARNAAAELRDDLNNGLVPSVFGGLHVPTNPVSPGDRALVHGAQMYAKYAAMEAAGQRDPNIIEGEEA